MSGRFISTFLGSLATLGAIVFIASCSGPDNPAISKAAPGTSATGAKEAVSAISSVKSSGSAEWVAYGTAKDGTAVYYDTKSVERNPGNRTVRFWSLVTPSKGSKIMAEMEGRLKKENKDYRRLHSLKTLHEANCTTMTYDMSKLVTLRDDGTAISEEGLNVRGRKPGPEISGLMARLCSAKGDEPRGRNASMKGAGQSGMGQPIADRDCENAGIMVLIQPAEAVTAGAQWRIAGGEWKNSGEKVCNLPVDEGSKRATYTIEYKTIRATDLRTPPAHEARVSSKYSYTFYNTTYAFLDQTR